MRVTPEGLALIRQFEGFRGEAYLCPAGEWTIGYGHTGRAGPPAVLRGARMSEGEARAVLEADVARFAADVRRCLTRELSDAEFSALVSFAYNVGTGNFRKSSVLKAINSGDLEAVPHRLQLWVKAGGRVLPGLVKRRAAEAALFVSGGVRQSDARSGAPDPVTGKPAIRSTTILSAIAAGLAALASLFKGAADGRLTPLSLVLALVVAASALWIIRERLRKSREDGI